MKSLSIVVSVIGSIIVSACATMQAPYVMYADKQVPLNETAVLVASQEIMASDHSFTSILSADGASAGCAKANEWGSKQCPLWVRVTPGSHTFVVRHKANIQNVGYGWRWYEWELPLTIPDMKPRHTYAVRLYRSGNQAQATYEDMGENSTYGLKLCGVYGDCKSTYTAKFE